MSYFLYSLVLLIVSGNLIGATLNTKDQLILNFSSNSQIEKSYQKVKLNLEDYLIQYFDNKEAVEITFLHETDRIKLLSQEYAGGLLTLQIGSKEFSSLKIKEALGSNKVWLTFPTSSDYQTFKADTAPKV